MQAVVPLAEHVHGRKGPAPLVVLGIALALFLSWTGSTQGQAATCSPLEARQQRELEVGAHGLLRVVRQADIEGLIALLADEVEIATDVVVTKQELARTLGYREGITYISLYDTPRYRTQVEGWRKRFTPQQREMLPPLDSVRSVQDHLLDAQHAKVRVCPFDVKVWGSPQVAVVGFDWPGRPSLMDQPNSMFVLTEAGWKISHLFSMIAW